MSLRLGQLRTRLSLSSLISATSVHISLECLFFLCFSTLIKTPTLVHSNLYLEGNEPKQRSQQHLVPTALQVARNQPECVDAAEDTIWTALLRITSIGAFELHVWTPRFEQWKQYIKHWELDKVVCELKVENFRLKVAGAILLCLSLIWLVTRCVDGTAASTLGNRIFFEPLTKPQR